MKFVRVNTLTRNIREKTLNENRVLPKSGSTLFVL